jgi:hypothetical protein
MAHDAMLMIRSDLLQRIDGIAAAAGKIGLATLCDQVDTIRRIARMHKLETVEGLASMLGTATAYHGHGPIIHSYLELMRDAVESDAPGAEIYAAYTAALSLRVGA